MKFISFLSIVLSTSVCFAASDKAVRSALEARQPQVLAVALARLNSTKAPKALLKDTANEILSHASWIEEVGLQDVQILGETLVLCAKAEVRCRKKLKATLIDAVDYHTALLIDESEELRETGNSDRIAAHLQALQPLANALKVPLVQEGTFRADKSSLLALRIRLLKALGVDLKGHERPFSENASQ